MTHREVVSFKLQHIREAEIIQGAVRNDELLFFVSCCVHIGYVNIAQVFITALLNA
jgi:hypothetical protein